MRRTGVVILYCLTFGLLLDNPTRGSEVTALKIRGKTFEPENKHLSYELWNESDQTITAWRLSLARSDPHGHAQKSLLDQDFFDRDGGRAREGLGPLDPGASLSGRWYLETGDEIPGRVALSVKVAVVIFDDWTWQGDQDAAEAILGAREARIEEIGKVLSALEGENRRLRSRQDWSVSLRQQAKLLRRQGENPELLAEERRETASVVSATRLELAQWLEDAGYEVSLAPDPTAALGHLKGALERRYAIGLQAVRLRKSQESSVGHKDGGEE